MVLVEHHDPLVDRTDPDYDGFAAPPNYAALRIRDDSAATPMIAMYVEYEGKDAAGTPIVEPCYYDLTTDPYERNNIYQSLSNERKQELHALLENNRTCGQAGKPMCWTVQQ